MTTWTAWLDSPAVCSLTARCTTHWAARCTEISRITRSARRRRILAAERTGTTQTTRRRSVRRAERTRTAHLTGRRTSSITVRACTENQQQHITARRQFHPSAYVHW